MTADTTTNSAAGSPGAQDPKSCPIAFERHAPAYRERFLEITQELQETCPIAWTESYGGHWVASTQAAVFDIARRADLVSSDRDVTGNPSPYVGTSIPSFQLPPGRRGGFLEQDPPAQREYRTALNPYLSPAAVERWRPIAQEIVRASINEKIEAGRLDFVDDVANIVPAVLTMAMLGLPLEDWVIYCEPAHASVYTPPGSPDHPRILEQSMAMGVRLGESVEQIRSNPVPGMIDALINATIEGQPPTDMNVADVVMLLIGGGFDTTTALTAHSLEWLSEHPDERTRLVANLPDLIDSATEEFLRFYTPAPGAARTIKVDDEVNGTKLGEGERLWLSWAMANRDPSVFVDPNEIHLDRPGNRHSSFGLGIHRCIGSNVARLTFKTMLTAVLERMPDFVCDPAGAVHYDTIGVIQGMRHLPATFTPGQRVGPGLDETIAAMQKVIDDQGIAGPITAHREAAKL